MLDRQLAEAFMTVALAAGDPCRGGNSYQQAGSHAGLLLRCLRANGGYNGMHLHYEVSACHHGGVPFVRSCDLYIKAHPPLSWTPLPSSIVYSLHGPLSMTHFDRFVRIVLRVSQLVYDKCRHVSGQSAQNPELPS